MVHWKRAGIASLLALAWALSAAAQQMMGPQTTTVTDTTGVLRGRVLDGEEAVPVPDATVMLTWVESGQQKTRTTKTDANGAYEFTELPVSDQIVFTVGTSVGGESIRRQGILLLPNSPEATVDLKRLPPVDDPSQVRIGRMTVVFPTAAPEATGAQVIEFVQLRNTGEAPVLQKDASGRTFGARLELPEGAHEPKAEGEDLATEIDGSTIYLTSPLKSGTTVVTISYHLGEAPTLDFSRKVNYPIDELLVLIAEPTLDLVSSGYLAGGTTNIHGEVYLSYSRLNVPPDSVLDLQLKRGEARQMPAPAAGPSMGGGGTGVTPVTSRPTTGGIPLTFVLLIGAIALASGGAIGAWITLSRASGGGAAPTGAPAPSTSSRLFDPQVLRKLSKDELDALKRFHLEQIATLDERFEAGEVPKAIYRQLREEGKARLGQVIAQLDAQ